MSRRIAPMPPRLLRYTGVAVTILIATAALAGGKPGVIYQIKETGTPGTQCTVVDGPNKGKTGTYGDDAQRSCCEKPMQDGEEAPGNQWCTECRTGDGKSTGNCRDKERTAVTDRFDVLRDGTLVASGVYQLDDGPPVRGFTVFPPNLELDPGPEWVACATAPFLFKFGSRSLPDAHPYTCVQRHFRDNWFIQVIEGIHLKDEACTTVRAPCDGSSIRMCAAGQSGLVIAGAVAPCAGDDPSMENKTGPNGCAVCGTPVQKKHQFGAGDPQP